MGDRLWAFRQTQPVDELLAQLLLHLRMLGGIDHYDAVLIEHALVALDQDFQFPLVCKVGPCGAVGQHVAVSRNRHLDRLIHTLARPKVPRTVFILDMDAYILVPDHEFSHMGAGTIAPRYEGC